MSNDKVIHRYEVEFGCEGFLILTPVSETLMKQRRAKYRNYYTIKGVHAVFVFGTLNPLTEGQCRRIAIDLWLGNCEHIRLGE